ncbi:EboA domain-containing protein [Agromyces subbeticus]|uniref:EboA domain-containing protein n=1 Tax=Agromyces subbeticus TaxID=293890 RepID=UPI000402C7C3|nr:EboA domain-containing protein [Agromyces subbeticus]
MTHPWTIAAVDDVTAEPQRISALFPAAGRSVGRDPIEPDADPLGLVHGTDDDAARAALVQALIAAVDAETAGAALTDLYRHGDDAERRGVLCGLNAEAALATPARTEPALAEPALAEPIAAAGRELVADALRTNDPRLVAAALGAFAAAHLDQHGWRHGVLKALFMGIPLEAAAGIDERGDAELARMAAALIAERRAAGRDINADMTRLATIQTTPGG